MPLFLPSSQLYQFISSASCTTYLFLPEGTYQVVFSGLREHYVAYRREYLGTPGLGHHCIGKWISRRTSKRLPADTHQSISTFSGDRCVLHYLHGLGCGNTTFPFFFFFFFLKSSYLQRNALRRTMTMRRVYDESMVNYHLIRDGSIFGINRNSSQQATMISEALC